MTRQTPLLALSWLELIFFSCYYGGLAGLGYHSLWRIALRRRNVALAIKSVLQTGRFADGTALTRRYTNLEFLDKKLVPAVIFYDGLLTGACPAYRLLLVDIHSTMQAMALCMLVSTRSKSLSTLSLLESLPTFWNVFNQFYGAAFVYPLYLLLEAVTTGFSHLYPVETETSRSALLVSAMIGSFLPFTFLWPAFHRSGTESRQRAIALYRFAPVVFSLLQIVGEKASGAQVFIQPTSQASPYLVAGCAATVGHWYALGGALVLAMRLSHRKGRLRALTLILQRVYLPRSAEKTTPLDASVLARAAHEFLQYDILVLVAAYIPYAYYLLAPLNLASPFAMVVSLVLGTIVLGPGAVLAFAYGARWRLAISE